MVTGSALYEALPEWRGGCAWFYGELANWWRVNFMAFKDNISAQRGHYLPEV